MTRLSVILFSSVMLTLEPSPIQAQTTLSFTVTDLGTLPNCQGLAYLAYGVNNLGEVAGRADCQSSQSSHAFLYKNGVMTDLGALLPIGAFSEAHGINRNGFVVGGWSGPRRSGAFLYALDRMINLPVLPDPAATAYAINNRGQIAGATCHAYSWRAVLWSVAGKTDLGVLPNGAYSWATALNDSGQVAGRSHIGGSLERAFLYAGGVMQDLGSLCSGGSSAAYAINSLGQVVGESDTCTDWYHPFLHSNGVMIDLGTLPGASTYGGATAFGINDSGWVVGTSWTGNGELHGFLYHNGMTEDLNSLIPDGSGWLLREARSVNRFGQITGWGTHNGQSRAYLLTPNSVTPQILAEEATQPEL